MPNATYLDMPSFPQSSAPGVSPGVGGYDELIRWLLEPRLQRQGWSSPGGTYSGFGPGREPQVSPDNANMASLLLSMSADQETAARNAERQRMAMETLRGPGEGSFDFSGVQPGTETRFGTTAEVDGMIGGRDTMPVRKPGLDRRQAATLAGAGFGQPSSDEELAAEAQRWGSTSRNVGGWGGDALELQKELRAQDAANVTLMKQAQELEARMRQGYLSEEERPQVETMLERLEAQLQDGMSRAEMLRQYVSGGGQPAPMPAPGNARRKRWNAMTGEFETVP